MTKPKAVDGYRCDQCRLWDRLPRGEDGVKGMCRVQPFVVVLPGVVEAEVKTAWPTTWPAEWCGNFTAKH